MGELVVIQTADMHGRLTVGGARVLAALKARHDALLLDCGDALDAANYIPRLTASGAAGAMNEAGYDAMALGNREYGWRSGTLAAKLGSLNFPVLAANLLAPPAPGCPVRASTILERGGLRVGVFGLGPNMAPAGSLAQRSSDIRFSDPEAAAREALAEMVGRCNLTIALIHWGRSMAQQRELVSSLAGPDLALMGHWHVDEGSLERVGETTISRCGSHATQAALLRLCDGVWSQELVSLQ